MSEGTHLSGERLPPEAGAAVALGMFAQLSQILIFREIMAICHGTEILFGVVLASGLAWTALGSAAATALTRKPGRCGPDRARTAFSAMAAVTGLLLAAEMLLARHLAGWGSEAAGQAVPLSRAAALSILVTAPVALLCGAQFVLALRALPRERFGSVYRAESWGAVASGLAFTFVLVHLVGPVRAALLGGAAFSAITLAFMWPEARWCRVLAVVGAAVHLAAALAPIEAPTEEIRWRASLPGYELLEFRDTPYGRAAALRKPGSSQISLFHNGSLVAAIEPDAPVTDFRHLADLCASLHPGPRSALLVGGALGPFPEEFLRHGLERVDAVELDPVLFDMARAHAPLTEDPRVRRIAADGRRFVKSSPAGSYDLVVLAGGEPDSATVNRYYTVEFFREARRALSEGGVLALFIPTYGGAAEYVGGTLARRSGTVWRALLEAFGHGRAAPVGGHMMVARKGETPPSLAPADLGSNLAERSGALPAVTVTSAGRVERIPVPPAQYFAALFGGMLAMRETLEGGERQEYIEALEQALSEAECRTNRDSLPAAVAEGLILGSEVTGDGREGSGERSGFGLAAALRAWGPHTLALPAIAAFVLAIVMIARSRTPRAGGRRRRGALLLSAFATGLFGMALEVGLLGAYQNVRGYVYGEIGGIIASFMAGLALGAFLAERLKARPRAILAAVTVGMILVAAGTPWAVSSLSGLVWSGPAAAGFWALVVLAGLLDGASFPVLVACGRGTGEERFGGWVYASDLAGAGAGALLCGAVWIPLFGLSGAMLAVTAILAAALASLLSLGPTARPGPSV